MAYDGTIMQRALARFDQAKQRRADELEQRRRLAFARQPRLAEIDRELRGTMGRIVTSALQKGTDPLPAIRVLRDENLELQRERAELLTAMGEPIDYLDDAPACPLCGDTGYRKGQVCDCLKKYYAREQLRELSRLLPLGEASFDSFRFDYYDDAVWPDYGTSPRANMERNFDVCRDYAYQFSKGSGSLLLSGGTGLGKTFLSACIARVVSDGGYSVVYDTAGRIFSQFEEAKFRGDAEGDADAKRCQRCDLLIVDDLGHGDDHVLRPERPVPAGERAADGGEGHHYQHQFSAGGAGRAVRRGGAVPAGGGVRDPALLRGGHPPAEAADAVKKSIGNEKRRLRPSFFMVGGICR